MKNKLIIILCIVAILGLLAAGVALKDSSVSWIAIVLVALIIVPGYIIYNAVLAMQIEKTQSASKTKSQKAKQKKYYSKAVKGDNGKLLYFPSNDKQ